MLTWGQGVFLAILQGIAELFPVSSLGHTVIIPALLGWGAVQRDPTFVPFVVLLHLGTAGALLWFYRAQWAGVVEAFIRSAVRGRLSHSPEEHLAWILFFGTVPAGVLGFLFEKPLKDLFATPTFAAVFLAINGGIMLATEQLRQKAVPASTIAAQGRTRGINDLGPRDAFVVGAAQSLALLPGISRSGVTMCAGLLLGMRHDDAAKYTFMLATPIIAAAGVLEIPILVGAGPRALAISVVGGAITALTAYLSVRYLTRYFRFGRLDPFAYYCIVAGVASLLYLTLHGA